MLIDLQTDARMTAWTARPLNWLLLLCVIAGVVMATLVWWDWSPWDTPAARLMRSPPTLLVPPVEPVQTLKIDPERARKINASVPLAGSSNPAAEPFRFTGSFENASRAEACLAAAAFYEAGNDPLGQAAVIQVILNRVRHPAFPRTICGVVLQGSERATGCQFSFTCDGSMARRQPTPGQMAAARTFARLALNGAVFAAVGHATHYHADYVVPRWSSTMDKILVFRSHLFYRWRGPAGDAGNFRGRYAGEETPGMLSQFVVPSSLKQEDAAAVSYEGESAASTVTTTSLVSGEVIRSDEWRGIYYIFLNPTDYPGKYAVKALSTCAGRKSCIVYGWSSVSQVPIAVTEARPPNILFVYARSPGTADVVEWDCKRIAREKPNQCLSGTAPQRLGSQDAPSGQSGASS